MHMPHAVPLFHYGFCLSVRSISVRQLDNSTLHFSRLLFCHSWVETPFPESSSRQRGIPGRLPAYLHRRLHGLSHSTTCSCICHMPYLFSITAFVSPSDPLVCDNWIIRHCIFVDCSFAIHSWNNLFLRAVQGSGASQVDFQHIYIEDYMDSAVRPLAQAHATCRTCFPLRLLSLPQIY